MCEAETLILAVEKYPCLWNIHDDDYHNRDVKDLAWENVFKEVIKDWDTCTKVDKENKGAETKKKWTHIRDYFRRDYQKNKCAPTGSAAKKVKKYVYADLLYFLIPVFDKRNTEGNYQSDDLQDNISQDSLEHSVEQVDTNILQPPSPISTPPAKSLKRNKKDIPSEILSILHQNQQKANQKQQEVEDDDMKFLLSFRTHMKNMNENQKINFKLGMLQLLAGDFKRGAAREGLCTRLDSTRLKMAVRIATGAVAHIGGGESFAIGCRSRHNFPQNIGRRFLPYKAMNLFPGRDLGRCRVQPEPVARSLIHRPCMRNNRYTSPPFF
ncbi:hypothetical protein EVAR_87191_1 [Eumeta japonica]|uniref:MADF domain-containing protein n=1 Tax=Eumeta variegata TaxID=151549 RepID=A0A4C1VVR1_EUMVA|nr:hypothetical protein EVAR_87191_1 [Eumeta japonica]